MKEIFYKATADLVFLVHFGVVSIVAIGWVVPGFFTFYVSILVTVLLSEIFFGYCVLTKLEFGIRKKLDSSLIFDKSCIMHYILKWRGLAPRPISSTPASFFKRKSFSFILLLLGGVSSVFNFFVY